MFPERVVKLTLQRFCAVPALDATAGAVKVMATSAVLAVQVPLPMVQRSTKVPYASAVKVELPLPEELNVPVPPLTMLQEPVPTTGVLPPRALLVSVPHRLWADPTLAAVGDW